MIPQVPASTPSYDHYVWRLCVHDFIWRAVHALTLFGLLETLQQGKVE